MVARDLGILGGPPPHGAGMTIGIFLPGLHRLGYSSRNTIIGSTRVAPRAGK